MVKTKQARRSSLAPGEDRLDAVFTALSDRTRRALLARLALGAAGVGELAAPFDMSLAAVSKHLSVLEAAGLVRKSRNGKGVACSLNGAPLQDLSSWIAGHRALWENALDALEAHFAGDDRT
jgi:DNA-binding transcriptional ArsR family regulator